MNGGAKKLILLANLSNLDIKGKRKKKILIRLMGPTDHGCLRN